MPDVIYNLSLLLHHTYQSLSCPTSGGSMPKPICSQSCVTLRGQTWLGLQVVEVVAESGAPKLDYEVLLEQQPCEVLQEQRLRQREAEQENQARLRSAQQEVGPRLPS